jgi:hypothetical protein
VHPHDEAKTNHSGNVKEIQNLAGFMPEIEMPTPKTRPIKYVVINVRIKLPTHGGSRKTVKPVVSINVSLLTERGDRLRHRPRVLMCIQRLTLILTQLHR